LQATAGRAFSISARVAYSAEGLASQVMEAGYGTRLQQERVAETATAMEEMNATVLEVARNASAAAEGAAAARTRADAGADVVQRSVTAIGRVSSLSDELRANMHRLGSQAEAIGQVMTVISDIADQTTCWR
jgi:methyl-accepting chemotaxis protein